MGILFWNSPENFSGSFINSYELFSPYIRETSRLGVPSVFFEGLTLQIDLRFFFFKNIATDVPEEILGGKLPPPMNPSVEQNS